MKLSYMQKRLVASSTLFSSTLMLVAAEPAAAQETPSIAETSEVAEVLVVTGSRIRRTETETEAPVSVVNQQDIVDRGYAQVGEALARNPSVAPLFNNDAGGGSASGDGRQYPNLFNLGAGRTLSLINGRRMAPSSNGSGDRVTDTNLVPTGLLERVDIVQGGGAAVYGSDAIAGVINYVLKQDFEGLVVDVQGGNTLPKSDYEKYAARITAGTNFADGRGNIAFNGEWNKTGSLLYGERKITDPMYRSLRNPFNTSATDGISARTPVRDPHFWAYNALGVISPIDSTDPNAKPNLQFSPDGQSIAAYNPGGLYAPPFACAVPFCEGGDGYPYGGLAAYVSGIENSSVTSIGHFDLTDRMKISAEFLYGRSEARDPKGTQPSLATIQSDGADGPVPFTRDNAFLTSSQIAALSAAYPGFASGDALYLSKAFEDLYPTREVGYTTDTYRGVLALDGDFDALGRNFYYNAFYSRSEVKGKTQSYGRYESHFRNAVQAVRNGAGQIVCAINADADPSNDDPACVPLNAFGMGNISPEARAYSVLPDNTRYTNTQDDFLASLGGDLITLPGGIAKFNVGYEHRKETTETVLSPATQLGLLGMAATPSTSGEFNTDEFSGELLIPLVGGDFTLPFVQELELSGQGRLVDHSLAGREKVWGSGIRWNVAYDLTLRGSVSRNFRAPTLQQITAPQVTGTSGSIEDPCDQRALNSGPSPATRLANCQALFAANPQWGPLADYQSPGFNFNTALITTGGNPNLRNEISDTKTFGFIWQPSYVPGNLTVVYDRIIMDLKDGLTPFTPDNFAQGCFDAASMPADLCSTFTRDPATGYIITALDTTFNAAEVRYRGDIINVNYGFPASWILPMFNDPGDIEISTQATHNDTLEQTVAGVTTVTSGTVLAPDWVVRTELRYRRGPLTASYELYYLPETKVNAFDTIETTPWPNVDSNTRHSISASYEFDDRYQLRAGIDNITNRQVSFPTFNYGDQIGRMYFIGLRSTF